MINSKKCFLHTLLLVVLAVSILFTAFTQIFAGADTVTYSNVLDDLQKDESFDIEDYPMDTDDHELRFVQLAESADDELLVYVYNPSWQSTQLTATKISMYYSTQPKPGDFTPTILDLTLLSEKDGFSKYKVDRWKVSEDVGRYYHVIGLYRAYNEDYDDTPDETITDSICSNVGQIWYYHYDNNNELQCEVQTMETLELDVTFNGRFRYSGGVSWGALAGLLNSCDSHFIAFNATNYQVKHIYDADLEYRLRGEYSYLDKNPFDYGWKTVLYDYGDVNKVRLKDSDNVTYNGGGLFTREYKWSRIMTAQEYVKNFEDQGGTISEDVKNQIQSSQWVFAFAETNVTETLESVSSYGASEVSILRIHFLDEYGNAYNLGVVANITSEDSKLDGSASPDVFDWWEELLKLIKLIFTFVVLIGLIILVITLCPWLPSLIWKVLKFVILFPVNLVKWIIDSIKKNKQNGQ